MKTGRILTFVNAAVLVVAGVFTLFVLVAEPEPDCSDAGALPLHAELVAVAALGWGVLALLVTIWLRMAVEEDARGRTWANRATWLALAVVVVAGIGVGAAAVRSICIGG